MNILLKSMVGAYSRILNLYPRRFRDEFAAEMLGVFSDSVKEAAKDGIFRLLLVLLRELGGLPFNVLREFWHELGKMERTISMGKNFDSGSHTGMSTGTADAILAAAPFMLFGIVSMLLKLQLPFHMGYIDLAFYAAVLLGLFAGLIRCFPRWAYSYLGWSIVFAWSWTNMRTTGLEIFGYTMLDEAWGWRIWYPLFITIGIASLWTRSLRPLRSIFLGIWQDWTLLSLGLYALSGMVFLLFDENHSPYLFAFMLATTLVIAASVWVYMKSTSTGRRFMVLFSGFVVSYILVRICNATWDWAAYHGFAPAPPEPWYMEIPRAILMTAVWSAIMFWPALIGFVRSIITNRQTPRLSS